MKKNILAILTFVFVFVILLPMSFAAQPSDTDDITGLSPYISGTASLGKVTNDKTFKYEFEIPEDSQSIYNSHIVEQITL